MKYHYEHGSIKSLLLNANFDHEELLDKTKQHLLPQEELVNIYINKSKPGTWNLISLSADGNFYHLVWSTGE